MKYTCTVPIPQHIIDQFGQQAVESYIQQQLAKAVEYFVERRVDEVVSGNVEEE